jgi:hypothetical protein
MWTQIVGKIRLALAPSVNHWWGVAFQLTARGLTTLSMPYKGASFEMTFDFCAHELQVRTNDARAKTVKLEPKSVAQFYAETMDALAQLGISVKIWPMPVEIRRRSGSPKIRCTRRMTPPRRASGGGRWRKARP